MLKLVVNAGLPLVAARTRDVVNLPDVLKNLTGKKPEKWAPNGTQVAKGVLYYFVHPQDVKVNFDDLYGKMVEKESTLLIVNPPRVTEVMFDAGEIPVPKPLLHQFMSTVTDSEDMASKLMLALGGVTIKEAAEFARLTMARDKSLTADGLMRTRKQFFQTQSGLTLVDTAQLLYVPDPDIASWVKKEKSFFLNGTDYRLIPRGLMFDGPPGTGKTSGAKFIASQWGVPLYRFDVGSTKTKWLGESEANMIANLARLDNEEPCVVLFDEIEKVFASESSTGDSGTTTTMMSQLLWWLAEHRSRVMVVMTTNNAKKLPKELYREGRVDAMMHFGGLEEGAARKLAKTVAATFKGVSFTLEDEKKAAEMALKASPIPTNPPTVSHAAVTKAVYEIIKSKG